MYYFGARYYDPETGRFITKDPDGGDVTDPQSPNPYVYVKNNPLNLIDPDGELVVVLVPVAGYVIAQAAVDLTAIGLGLYFVSKGDDPALQDQELKRKEIERLQKILKNPSVSQRERTKARKRIRELQRRHSKKAHGADKKKPRTKPKKKGR